MSWIADKVVRHPIAILALFVIAWIAAGATYVSRARYDFSFETMAPRHSVEFQRFREFEELFEGGDDVFAIVFRDDPLVTAENLRLIQRLTDRISELDETASLLSLTNVNDIRGTEDSLEVLPFVDGIPEDSAALERLRTRLTSDPLLLGNLISADGTTTALIGRLREWVGDPQARTAYFDRVRSILDTETDGGVEFHLSGIPYLDQALMRNVLREGVVYIPICLAVFAVILWRVIGRRRAAWMATLPVVIGATLTMAYITGLDIPLSLLTGSNTLTVLILAIGISDAIHLMTHYEEEIRKAPDENRAEPLRRTIRHLGTACLLTSATTAIGLGSLAIVDVRAVRDFGIFGALGVMTIYLVVIFCLPAAMFVVDRWRRSVPRSPGHRDALDRLLARVADRVIAHPRLFALVGVGVLAVSVALLPQVRIDNRFSMDLAETDPAIVSQRYIEEHLTGLMPFEVLVKTPGADEVKDPKILRGIEQIQRELESIPDVATVTSPVDYLKRMNRAMHAGDSAEDRLPETRNAVAQYLLLFELAGGDAEYDRLVTPDYGIARVAARLNDVPPERIEAVRDRMLAVARLSLPEGTVAEESGGAPLFARATREVVTSLLQSLFLAMPIVFLVIGLTFRSVRIGLLSALPNLIPITFAMGFLAASGISLRFATIVAFPLAFGIAVDDTIHFLARYRSEIRLGANPESAVRTTLQTAGRAMLTTTILFVSGWSIMMGSDFVATVHIALLSSLILVMALLGDLFVLPSLILLVRPPVR